MKKSNYLKVAALGGASVIALSTNAFATEYNIPGGDLKSALDAYAVQTHVSLIVSGAAVKDVHTAGAKGELTADAALSRILTGTGFTSYRNAQGEIGIVPGEQHAQKAGQSPANEIADAAPVHAASNVETVVVTSSKIKGDIQTVPIAITALSQEQLTSRQIAGGPDLVKEVPNLTFSKTNFTGYNIEIRGIGTQAISVTTDPAVAVAFNDTPFIRNHFFEQEFYDVAQVEVLRGPQGTLYGRNATAGVVNVVSARPTDQFEAMVSADWGNYTNRRYEGMVNLPIVSDKLDLRVAAEWTKRDGYSFNSLTTSPIDGRDLWSSRTTLRWKPVEGVMADFIWEHFSENDDRLRSSKQLCKRDYGPATVLGISTAVGSDGNLGQEFLSQACGPVSLYSSEAFEVPNARALPYYGGFVGAGFGLAAISPLTQVPSGIDPYASAVQSHNLRVIESSLNPTYRAKNDTLEFNVQWSVAPSLTFYSDTAYNHDFLWSTEDYNRFATRPGIFAYTPQFSYLVSPDGNYDCKDGTYSAGGNHCSNPSLAVPTAVFCDPQLGCSSRLVAEDLSDEHAWQVSQEVRLASDFKGPLNFSVGGNYMHYETEENYYVFINTLPIFGAAAGAVVGAPLANWTPGNPQTQDQCLVGRTYANPFGYNPAVSACMGWIDANPIGSLDNAGHNYFLSQNPYVLNSYAGFGEAYYDLTKDVKLTAGLRWTDDKKHFIEIPSEILTQGYGYPSIGNLDQEWKEWTGRFVADWTPRISFTDQTMLYASYAHGYKAGGANPPGAVLLTYGGGDIGLPSHPIAFKPEFNDAFEIGTKNTVFDGDLTFNGDIFYYKYTGYQISQIVDRTSVNLNFNATVKGAEMQATWSPAPGLKLGFAGGYESTRLVDGSQAIDLMDRTAGNPNWLLVKPFPTQASNCVLPAYVVAYVLNPAYGDNSYALPSLCGYAYGAHDDPVTGNTYTAYPSGNTIQGRPINPIYPGFDPLAGTQSDPYTGQNTFNGIDYGPAPNGGTGFYKNLSGNELPNAPHYTVSLTADYTMPMSANWAATLHGDFYWQSQSWARVFNDRPYDKLRGYSNVNTALILTDASGWQVMGYVKNIFNTTAITGDFLNSDDSGLTTNVFLTDPRLYGVRITKNFEVGSSGFELFSDSDGKRPDIWLTLGGDFARLQDNWQHYTPAAASLLPGDLPSPNEAERSPATGLDWEGKITFQPENSDWLLKAGIRYGRSSTGGKVHASETGTQSLAVHFPPSNFVCKFLHHCTTTLAIQTQHLVDSKASASERHAILDFTLGKDIGIGIFGPRSIDTVGFGVRAAQFDSRAYEDPEIEPLWILNANPLINQYGAAQILYDYTAREQRSFRGMGPELTWDVEQPVLGSGSGELALDWGINAAMLFGRQRARIDQTVIERHVYNGAYQPANFQSTSTPTTNRSRSVTVPNLGGYAGLSFCYNDAKFSFGYRADEFFGAMDGGQDTAKKYNRGFYGPYLNFSIGFGG